MRPRLVLIGSVVFASVMILGHPATAKLPPWTCEPSTTRPIVGQGVTIVVRFWDRRSGQWVPARWLPLQTIPSFVEARSDSSGGPGHPVLNRSIHLVRPGVYEATIVFPDTSRYRLTGCGRIPHYATDPGFDPATDLVIRPIPRPERGATRPWRGSSGDREPSSILPVVGGFAAAIFLTLAVHDRSRRRAVAHTG
jgi:hypothetical protein